MSDIEDKSTLILEQEGEFAFTLASRVIDKPQLSIWMILIPIFFVFYFYQLNRYKNGRTQFVEHYLVSKKRALNEAIDVVAKGREPDVSPLAALSDLPDEARAKQANVLTILVEHYTLLLKSSGTDFASLVREAYGNLTDYLLFHNRLNQAERQVTKALKPVLKKTYEGIDDVVNSIEKETENLRRELADDIFR